MNPEPSAPGRVADRLRAAAPADRPVAFREVYDRVLRRVLAEREESGASLQLGANEKIARFVRGVAGCGRAVLEVGCGFGTSALLVARGQREVIGVDAAPVAVEVAARRAAGLPHVRFQVMDAARLEFPEGRFDVVYSIDLIEHLHPEDVPAHLAEAHRVLRSGGLLIVKTPSVLTGPHEGEDPGDQGFLHFQEYRYGTLLPLLRDAGFVRPRAPAFSLRIACRLPGRARFPAAIDAAAESICLLAPDRSRARRFLARFLGLKQVVVVAERR